LRGDRPRELIFPLSKSTKPAFRTIASPGGGANGYCLNLEELRMDYLRTLRVSIAIVILAAGPAEGTRAAAADAPTPEQALAFTPMQPHVDYTTPAKDQIPQCTVRAEKDGGATAWVVRNRQGEILRRFADSNGDNFVDTWSYYLDGLEVYRDIDSDFNRKADQYRWLNTGGTRWGVDRDEDGRIDAWRAISPHEVAEQLVLALANRDPARFELILLTPAEIGELGVGKARADQIGESLKAASAGFRKLAAEQKLVSAQSRYVDIGSARPATIPAGTAGSTKDVTTFENATALVQTDGKHEQVFLGTLVAVNSTWKLVGLPALNTDGQSSAGLFLASNASTGASGGAAAAPTDEMQRLMADLERLDQQSAALPTEKQTASVEQRADLLRRLAEVTPDPELRDQWYRQWTDMLSVAAQGGSYPQGLEQLEQLRQRLADAEAGEELIAHADFQRMSAQYVLSQQQPGNDAVKTQEKWLADLEAFVKEYPKSADAAEALLQLGMYQEFIGKMDEAKKWYQQLVTGFPNAPPARKAAGALRRSTSVGKPIPLRGQDVAGAAIDLASYRGKVVLIHYWATWCEPCKQDMVLLKDFHAKNASRGFDIIGVCLDNSAPTVRQFLTQNRFPWKQMHEAGGLDGRLANELGVMTLPLMLLVDQRGNLVKENIHVAELDGELAKLLK
jgi:thiol-disulfide isomerase/thioredoxin